MTSDGARPERPGGRSWIVAAGIAAAALLVARFLSLDADPPTWAGEDFFLDGGWWGGSARSTFWFGTPDRIDAGLMHYVVPGYSAALVWIFGFVGESTEAARLLSAIASLVTVLLASTCAFRLRGLRGAVLTALLLAVSPMCWAHGRAELVAPLLSLAICVSVTLLVWWPRGVLAPLAAGLALAWAFSVKGTATYAGMFPVLGALAVPLAWNAWRRRAGAEAVEVAWTWRTLLLVAGGIAAGAVVFYVVHVAPDQSAFLQMASDLSGRVQGRHFLSIPGRTMVSKTLHGNAWSAETWHWMTHSPVLFASAWLLAIGALGRAGGGWTSERTAPFGVESYLRAWCVLFALGMLATPYQPDYRWLPVVPVLAVIAPAVFLGPVEEARSSPGDPSFVRRIAWNFVALFVWTLPVQLAARAPFANELARRMEDVAIGNQPGVSVFVTATVFVVGCCVVLLVAAVLVRRPLRVQVGTGARVGVALAALLVVEVGLVGSYAANLRYTQAEAQHRLSESVPRDTEVGGRAAGSLLAGSPVVPVRRVTPATADLPVDAEAWGASRPERFLVVRTLGHRPSLRYGRERAYLEGHGWKREAEFRVGEEVAGTSFYEIELWRRQ